MVYYSYNNWLTACRLGVFYLKGPTPSIKNSLLVLPRAIMVKCMELK